MIKEMRMFVLGLMLLGWNAYSEGEGINIIPRPKEMKIFSEKIPLREENTVIVLGANADKKSILGAEEINKRIEELGGKPLAVARENESSKLNGKSLIVIGSTGANKLLDKELACSKLIVPEQEQGYLIFSQIKNDSSVSLLVGKDSLGELYACVTFKKLIRKDDNGLYICHSKIRDWPDCGYRSAIIGARHKSPWEKSIPYLDWCLSHKVNYLHVDIYFFSNGDYTVPDEKATEWLRHFNDNAAKRGITTIAHCLYWNIGYLPKDKNKPEFKGCIENGKGFWCWSRDALIEKRAVKIGKFVEASHFNGIVIHAIDGSSTEKWNQRCSGCRKRFGDDRAAADANFINIMSKNIRSTASNDTKLLFVVEPYYGNLNLKENKVFKDYFVRLTSLIPENVYLTNASWDRESQKSWNEVVKQPILQWRNMDMDPFHMGRRFSTMPSFSVKSGFFPGSKNIPFPATRIGASSVDEIIALQSIEFMWNVNAPGSMVLRSDAKAKPYKFVENLYALPIALDGMDYHKWLWFKSATEPESVAYGLLPMLCEEVFGKEAAPMMAKILRMGISRTALMLGPYYNKPTYYNILRDPEIVRDQYEKAEKALNMLEEFKKEGKHFKAGLCGFDWFENFLSYMKLGAIGGKSHYHILLAEKLSKENKLADAEKNLKIASDNLKKAEACFKPWRYAKLKEVKKLLESMKFRLSIMKLSPKEKKEAIKVAIYNPNNVGGKVAGEQAIFNTLAQDNGIEPVFINSMKNLFQYDCVIVSSCKKFGKYDNGTFILIEKEVWNAELALRDYVIKEGGGLLLCHDSVGSVRFPLGKSVFPEICKEAKQEKDRSLEVLTEHPAVKGYKKGERRDHMYSDHFSMKKGKIGETVLVDKNNSPVLIAAEIGKGRLLMNGSVVFTDKGEPDVASGIDKDILLNSVRWLAGKEK